MSVTINGSGSIVGSDRAALGLNSDIITLNGVTTINGGQLAGMRNRIINGACDIAQRGSTVYAGTITSYGGPDRFLGQNNGGGGQFTQSQATLTYGGLVKNTVRQTANTAATTLTGSSYWFGLVQFIEGINCYDLKGQPIVVSFIFNTNLAGTYNISVRDGGSSYCYVSTFTVASNTPTKVVLAIPAIPIASSMPNSNAAGLSVTIGFLNQGVYQTTTLNSWQTGNLLSSPGEINWSATAGNFIELTELQVEIGTIATTFERRSYGVELALCQRYVLVLRSYTFVGVCTVRGGGTQTYGFVSTPVSMRATPTITGLGTLYAGDTIGVMSTWGTPVLAANGLWVSPAVSPSLGTAAGCAMIYTDSNINTFSAEL